MKRSLIVIFFAGLAATLSVDGQVLGSIGGKAGVSIANQNHQITPLDYTLDTESIVGPGFAFFLEAFRGRQFSFQTDLAFTTKGSKTSIHSVTVNHLENDRIYANRGDVRVSRFYYLSLSPMARYRIELDRITPYVLLGLRVDFLLKYDTDSDYPLEDQNAVIPGLTGGLGLEYSLYDMALFLEFQYQSDAMPVTGRDPLLINNNVFLFTLGVRYLLSD